MGFPILVRWHLYIETAPRYLCCKYEKITFWYVCITESPMKHAGVDICNTVELHWSLHYSPVRMLIHCWPNPYFSQCPSISVCLIGHHCKSNPFNGWSTLGKLVRKAVAWMADMDGLLMEPCITHWGRVTHICVSKLTIIGSENVLSPDRRQGIIWINDGLLLIGPWGTNFSEILIEILTFSFKKMRLKVSSAKRRPFCLGLNVIIESVIKFNGQGNDFMPKMQQTFI